MSFGDISAARSIARQRVGRQRPGESDEDYAQRIADATPTANAVPIHGTTETGRSAATERQQRRVKP